MMSTINFYRQDLTFEHLQDEYNNAQTVNQSVDANQQWNTAGVAQEVLSLSHTSVFLWHIRSLKLLIERELDSAVVNEQNAKNQLVRDIAQVIKNFNVASLATLRDQPAELALIFANDARTLVNKYTLQNVSDFSWTPLVKNLLLLGSVVGTIPALFSIGSKIFKGHYAFFDGKGIEDCQLKEPVSNVEHRFKKQVQEPVKFIEQRAEYAPVQRTTNTRPIIDLNRPITTIKFDEPVKSAKKHRVFEPTKTKYVINLTPHAPYITPYTPFSNGAPGVFTASIKNGQGAINGEPINIKEPVTSIVRHNDQVFVNGNLYPPR